MIAITWANASKNEMSFNKEIQCYTEFLKVKLSSIRRIYIKTVSSFKKKIKFITKFNAGCPCSWRTIAKAIATTGKKSNQN